MKSSLRPLLISAAIAFFLTFALAAFAQEKPAPAPVAPARVEPAVASVAPALLETSTAADPEKSTLRRIDPDPEPSAATGPKPTARVKKQSGGAGGDLDRVVIFGENVIATGDKVLGEAVVLMGDLRVDGEVAHDAVAVMGSVTINGKVEGGAIVVMGDMVLGPKAEVGRDVVVIGGTLRRDPGALVGGEVKRVGVGKLSGEKRLMPASLQAWWDHALSHAALLGWGAGLGWLLVVTLFSIGFRALLALVFPDGIRRVGDVLRQRPGAVVLSALLTMMALPVLFILLLITVVGIPVALLGLPIGIVIAVGFGTAGIYGLVGRKIMQDRSSMAVAVVVGGLAFALLYAVPFVGLALWALTSALGLGCSIAAMLTAGKNVAAPTLPVVPFTPPAMPASVSAASAGANAFTVPGASETGFVSAPTPSTETAGFGAPEAIPPVLPAVAPMTPPPLFPPVANAPQPRAGFWVRMAALLIDLILIGIIFGPTGAGALILPGLAAYGAVMWKFKGTTIGGIVCGLRVVRLDDRELDWPTTVVRALGCFLSLAVAGLGFVWVVFDPERQSWHDKIAGTVVVRAPKGTSLI